jgi:hypothetical protein
VDGRGRTVQTLSGGDTRLSHSGSKTGPVAEKRRGSRMRSLFAIIAAAWFGYHALSFLPPMAVHLNDGAVDGIDGDPTAVAVTWAARYLFAGLAFISLALVDWAWIVRRERELRGD